MTQRANVDEILSGEWRLVENERGKRLCFSVEGSDWCEDSPFLTGEDRARLWAIPGCAGGAGTAFKSSYSVTCLRSVSRWTLVSVLRILEWLCMLEYKQWSLLFPFPCTFTCWKMSEEAKEKNAKPAHRKKKGKKVTPCTVGCNAVFWVIWCSSYLLLGVEWLWFDNLFRIRMVVESGWFCLC